jgi:16S rRNA (cytosine1402-N4)-methyltransferase
MTHTPVLLDEVIALLAPGPGETVADLTAGRGGHAAELARRVGPGGHIVLLDVDAGNLAHAAERVREQGVPVTPVHGTFADIARHMARLGLRAHAALADLGFASTQMDDPERGFSVRADGPLDMRLDRTGGRTAADLVATLPERDLADAIFQLGEDPFARRIARAIVERRARAPIERTLDLASVVQAAYGPRARHSRLHPATRTFMALRILVNGELDALRHLLAAVEDAAAAAGAPGPRPPRDGGAPPDAATPLRAGPWLHAGARVGVISFHSLEDRLVKHAFASLERRGLAERRTRKPVEAAAAEVAENPRARSAKLRVVRLGSDAPAQPANPAQPV